MNNQMMMQQQQGISLSQLNEKIKECILTDNIDLLKKLIIQYNILYQPIDEIGRASCRERV